MTRPAATVSHFRASPPLHRSLNPSHRRAGLLKYPSARISSFEKSILPTARPARSSHPAQIQVRLPAPYNNSRSSLCPLQSKARFIVPCFRLIVRPPVQPSATLSPVRVNAGCRVPQLRSAALRHRISTREASSGSRLPTSPSRVIGASLRPYVTRRLLLCADGSFGGDRFQRRPSDERPVHRPAGHCRRKL